VKGRIHAGDGSKWLADLQFEENDEVPQFQRRGPIPNSQKSNVVWGFNEKKRQRQSWPLAIAAAFLILVVIGAQFG
jgi:hypothetical protein